MRHSLRKITAMGCLGWATVTLALHGCSNRLGPVQASQNVGGIGRATLPDIALERAKECMADDGSQLPPGLVDLKSIVEVDQDRYKVGVTLDGVPQTAPDFAACMRNVLRDMPIAEGPLQEGVATLQYRREHANDGPVALRRFIEVIPGAPIVESELVLQADGHTVLLPVTIRVVDKQVKQLDLDKALLAKIGQMALASLGYDEIMKRAEQMGWVKTVRVPQAQASTSKQFVADAATIAQDVFQRVFTKAAPVALGISLADTPAPGIGDILGIGVIAGALIVTGGIIVYEIATAPATAVTSAPPVATATATPTATATTTTTSPPIAVPRRWPGQTCENKRLDELEAAKKAVCEKFPGRSCSDRKVSPKLLEKYPCSLVKGRIAAMSICHAARQKVQDECFKNATDAGHADQIQSFINGITECELLKGIVCAPGHPMAGL